MASKLIFVSTILMAMVALTFGIKCPSYQFVGKHVAVCSQCTMAQKIARAVALSGQRDATVNRNHVFISGRRVTREDIANDNTNRYFRPGGRQQCCAEINEFQLFDCNRDRTVDPPTWNCVQQDVALSQCHTLTQGGHFRFAPR
ncbi:uncharacterized protein LOC116337187 [Contarinia nasturtii]|uniref:uncharacterized protein LOC116337187 n=1 Tax=Contarinia nasturtii TaxID=265458 RepID=UPI0012D4228D|nr:uncharacterized protein LOC116337187 [Contarinia nasturtii]